MQGDNIDVIEQGLQSLYQNVLRPLRVDNDKANDKLHHVPYDVELLIREKGASLIWILAHQFQNHCFTACFESTVPLPIPVIRVPILCGWQHAGFT